MTTTAAVAAVAVAGEEGEGGRNGNEAWGWGQHKNEEKNYNDRL